MTHGDRAWCRALGNFSPMPRAVRHNGQLTAIFPRRTERDDAVTVSGRSDRGWNPPDRRRH